MPRELLGGILGLRDQHGQSAGAADSPLPRLKNQGGAQRVVHNVEHPLQPRKIRQANRFSAQIGEHSKRRRVHKNFRIRVAERRILIIFLPAARKHNHLPRAGIARCRPHRQGGTAAAADQHLFPGKRNPCSPRQAEEPRIVGIVPEEPAVPQHQRVDAADLAGRGGKLVAVGNHRPLVGNGHIESLKIPGSEKSIDFLPRDGAQLVAVSGKLLMDPLGIAVAEPLSDQSILHCAHSFTARYSCPKIQTVQVRRPARKAGPAPPRNRPKPPGRNRI